MTQMYFYVTDVIFRRRNGLNISAQNLMVLLKSVRLTYMKSRALNQTIKRESILNINIGDILDIIRFFFIIVSHILIRKLLLFN